MAGRPWRLSARLLIACSVLTVIGFSAICANVMLDMRRGEEELARQSLDNLASSIDADISRNIELYDLSLRAVASSIVLPEIKDVSKTIRHLILFDHAATAKHFGAIQVFDAFPLLRADRPVLYCLALEYAPHGDLRAFLHKTARKWPEPAARREIAGILQVLQRLHRGQMLHRDLTPMNVFVCGDRTLKLGDFGIVRHQSDRRGIRARTMNRLTAPLEILDGAVPKWQARDDVYQVGQLLGMLIKGDARVRIRTHDVRALHDALAVQRGLEGG